MEEGPRTFSFSNLTEDHANCACFGPPRLPYLRILLALTLGIGKSFWSALTYDEILWFIWHKRFIEDWIKKTWRPCPSMSDAYIHWDLVQTLTFVGTAGSYVAERRGSITSDGYLLISHKLHAVPKHIQERFYNPRAFTITTLLVVWLTEIVLGLFSSSALSSSFGLRRPTWLKRLSPPPAPMALPCPRIDPEDLLEMIENPRAAVVKGDDEHRVISQGECLLPVESTRATESNIIFLDNTPRAITRSGRRLEPTSPSPNDYSGGAQQYDHTPPPPLNDSVRIEQRKISTAAMDYHHRSIERTKSQHKLVVFQHGLLESSTSWIFTLWSAGPDETIIHVPIRLIRFMIFPIVILISFIRHIIRQATCLIPTRKDRQSISRMKYSLPINAMLEDPSLEVWLTNTRGSTFSCNLRNQKLNQFPCGNRRLINNEYRQIFNVYTEENWTYIDSAILDCEALYNMLFQYYKTSRLNITTVAFSQGCAAFALNASIKAEFINRARASDDKAEDITSLSPPDFPLIGATIDEISVNVAYSSPRPESARVVTPPPLASAAWERRRFHSFEQERAPSEECDSRGMNIESGWTSAIFSEHHTGCCDFDITHPDHLRGNCSGLKGGCEYCNIFPQHLILIAPPVILKHLTAPAKSISECWKVVFCKQAWTHLHYMVAFVTLLQSFLPVRFGLVGQVFVQYILGFGIRPMHRNVADLIYKLVPSGMTTRENMFLWNSQMDGNTVLGSDLKYEKKSLEFAQYVWKVKELPRHLDLDTSLPCSTTIYSGLQDNIADSIGTAEQFMRSGNATLRVLDANESSCQLQLNTNSKNTVNLIAGSSHMDILWPASNNRLIQYIMDDVLKAATDH